jgi:uncharacterized protein YigA (DUF484 family)
MNTTTTASRTFAHLPALSLTLFRMASHAISSRVSYMPIPHIKLKAEHQALVLFHVVRHVAMYWERRRERKQNAVETKEDEKVAVGRIARGQRKNKEKGQGRMVVARGRYTVVFR